MNYMNGWMNGANGWMGGGMWLWTVIGVLLVVFLVVVITSCLNNERCVPMPVQLSADESVSEAAVKRENASTAKVESSAANPIYTCPMHPEVAAGPSRRLPQVRHGAGTEDGDSGHG